MPKPIYAQKKVNISVGDHYQLAEGKAIVPVILAKSAHCAWQLLTKHNSILAAQLQDCSRYLEDSQNGFCHRVDCSGQLGQNAVFDCV